MAMVPTYQIINLKADCCRNVEGVSETALGKHSSRNVGASKRFHFLAD